MIALQPIEGQRVQVIAFAGDFEGNIKKLREKIYKRKKNKRDKVPNTVECASALTVDKKKEKIKRQLYTCKVEKQKK